MEIEEYLERFAKFTKIPSLDVMKWLMNQFENPQEKLKIIHAAGTNGKGSVCEMTNNILIKAGYRVGKFISPHLITFHETICINNEPITEEEVQAILIPLAKKIEEYNQTHVVRVTWFEVITSLALIYFGKQQCDIVIVETGMGGTYDCTNIVTSMISMITSIGMDHMDVLGSTIQEIASNKAGIIKEKGETIFIKQQEEVNMIIKQQCQKKNNTLHLLKENDIKNYSYNSNYQMFDYKQYQQVCVNLKGKKQIQNAIMCIECMGILKEKGYHIAEQDITEGLRTVIHPARFETIATNPTIIFDGGHNEKAIENLKETIKTYYKDTKKVYIISILATKDYVTMLKQIVQEEEAVYIFTDGNDKNRYVAKEKLEKEARKQGKGKLLTANLEQAIQIAKMQDTDATIFIIGSFYIYKTVLEIIRK